jgi:hypothetical protein
MIEETIDKMRLDLLKALVDTAEKDTDWNEDIGKAFGEVEQ